MKRWFFVISFLFLYSISTAQNKETITQVSTIDALLLGVYDGQTTIGELKTYGDFGIGTFNTLDGEMVVVDNKCYQIKSDGTINEAADTTKTPFSAVAFFNESNHIQLKEQTNFKTLENLIDSLIPTKNIFYGIKIKGKFKTLRARSVAKQSRPYRPLTEVVKSQSEFNFEDVEGVLVGFRCPPYVKGVNVPGYHLHFLNNDKKSGGHVLGFEIKEAELYLEEYSDFRMLLPDDKDFYNADLSHDQEQQLKKVEK